MNQRQRVATTCGLLLGLWATIATPAHAGPPQPATEEEITKLIASTGDADDFDGADWAIVLDEADVYVQESGLATTKSCRIIKVLTDAGARAHAVLHHEFDPATNRVTIAQVRIRRADGAIEDVPLSGIITTPAPQHAIYWGNQQKLLDLPRLEVGDCLEVRISKIGYNIAYLGAGARGATGGGAETLQPPMPGHWYEVTRFQGSHPIVQQRYSVHMPKDKPVQYEVYNGELKSSLWFSDQYDVYTFTAEDVPALGNEPRRVGADDLVVKVVMATITDWETKSRWFWEANAHQFEADEAIRRKVRELTAGLRTDEEKIAALNHWVADNVRYCGTSRGPCEGFTLHKGPETFRDRAGVCKDKAGMLITMLRAAEIEAYPALTMAGSRVEDIPADQFNHTVTAVRQEDGSFRIYDPTWIPLSRDMWSPWEALQGLVYGTPEGQTLTLSPFFPPEHNRVDLHGKSRIDAAGTLSTRLTCTVTGRPDTSLRRYVHRNRKPDRRAAFESVLSIAPTARIEQLSYTDPFDYSTDAHVDLKVSAADYAAGTGTVRMFHLPLMTNPLGHFTIPDFFTSVEAETRKYGMRLHSTKLVRYEETVVLPPGWKVEHVPEKKTLESGSASLSFEATPGEDTLTYRFELILKHNIVPPEDYAGWKEALDTWKELGRAWVICRVTQP